MRRVFLSRRTLSPSVDSVAATVAMAGVIMAGVVEAMVAAAAAVLARRV